MDYRPFGLLDMTPGFPAGGVAGRTPSGADDLGRLLYSMTGAGGAQDAAGLLGGPSVRENLRSGNNFDAGLQMLAALPVVGMLGTAGKVARGAQDAAKAAEEARGIIAYHGSPHSFDKFDLSKIGTGEGAQAYGHGLYFAESEGVAKSYRDGLTDPDSIPLHFKDRPVDQVWNDGIIERWPEISKGMTEKQLDDFTTVMGNISQVNHLRDLKNVIPNFTPSQKRMFETLISPGLTKPELGPGSMYQVRINADPNAFLDWDKPLSEHPEMVRRKLGWTPEAEAQYRAAQSADDNALLAALEGDSSYVPTRIPVPAGLPPLNKTGADIVRGGSVFDRASDIEKAAKLREAGIPGIKYLDAGSRGSGEGSRNYVVFDDSLIDILKKYGLIGLLGGGAAASGVSGMNTTPSMPNSAPGL